MSFDHTSWMSFLIRYLAIPVSVYTIVYEVLEKNGTYSYSFNLKMAAASFGITLGIVTWIGYVANQ